MFRNGSTLVVALAGPLFVSCGSAPVPTRPEADRTASAVHAEQEEREKPSPTRAAPTPGPAASASPAAAAAFPFDPAFLDAPLPPIAPDRYRAWREVLRIDVGQSHLTELDRLPSGHFLTLSQTEGRVRVYEPRSKRLLARHEVPGIQELESSALLAFPTAPDRFVLGNSAGLGVYDATSGDLVQQVDTHAMWRLRWSDDGRILMALGAGRPDDPSSLFFFVRGDDGALTLLQKRDFPYRIDAWALSRDARLLVVVRYPAGFEVLDLERQRVVYAGEAPRYGGDVTFSPDGRFVAVAGDGLLVVDLADTRRRAFYSYVKNNIGHVRFSPSSDAIIASSYDGKIRIFATAEGPSGELVLPLLRELSHAGNANVYDFVLSADGSELASASGDRTLRVFADPARKTTSTSEGEHTFHDLDTWKKLRPPSTAPAKVEQRHVSPVSRPSRIAPGRYACKITAIYKLRDCTVYLDQAGRTHLEFAEDNLLHLGGVLWDDGPAVRFEGKLLSPSSVINCAGCEEQPIHAVIRGERGRYEGLLTFRNYHDPLVPLPIPPLDVRIEEANDRYPLVLEYRGPLPKE